MLEPFLTVQSLKKTLQFQERKYLIEKLILQLMMALEQNFRGYY